MNLRTGLVVSLVAMLGASAGADTIYLKNGVRFDGVVTPVPAQDGLYKVSAGDRQMIYRESEIDRIEKNDRTGHLDKDDLLRRWEEKNKELTEETGLTAEQRRQVRAVMYDLKHEDPSIRIAARDKLMSYQEEFDVFGYLALRFPEFSALMAPNVLEVMAQLDPVRSVPLVKEATQANHYAIRAKAVELLGRMRLADATPLVARGLVDFDAHVQTSAAHALALLDAKAATPALIQLLTFPDLPVAGAARQALETLWSEDVGDKAPRAVSEWTAFWESKQGQTQPLQLAGLEPLSPEEDEIRSTYDSNH